MVVMPLCQVADMRMEEVDNMGMEREEIMGMEAVVAGAGAEVGVAAGAGGGGTRSTCLQRACPFFVLHGPTVRVGREL